MNDEDLLQQATNCPTVYLDGLGAFRTINGVWRSVGFVIGAGACLNLFISVTGADAANRESRRVLDEKPTKGVVIWNTSDRLSH